MFGALLTARPAVPRKDSAPRFHPIRSEDLSPEGGAAKYPSANIDRLALTLNLISRIVENVNTSPHLKVLGKVGSIASSLEFCWASKLFGRRTKQDSISN